MQQQLHLAAWVDFYQSVFPSSEVPPMPKTPKELPLTVRMALENWDQGRLNQNLFGNAGLGVGLAGDVQLRLQKGELLATDATALRRAGLTYEAEKCEALGQREEASLLAANMQASEERFKAQQKAHEEFQKLPLGHPLKAPSPESVARAREEFGLTGRPSWEQ